MGFRIYVTMFQGLNTWEEPQIDGLDGILASRSLEPEP